MALFVMTSSGSLTIFSGKNLPYSYVPLGFPSPLGDKVGRDLLVVHWAAHAAGFAWGVCWWQRL